MGFFSNLFKRKARYTDGSVECTSQGVHNILMVGKIATSRDANYLTLDENKLKDFVFKYYDKELVGVGYHSNSEEFPDCDDFAAIAYASILRGAVKEGFKYPPVFGMISVKLKKGTYHRLNFAMTTRPQVLIFEPQTGKWTTLQDYAAYEMAEITGMDL